MLSLVYILCDSIFKDIGQFKIGLPISPFESYSSFNQLYIYYLQVKSGGIWRISSQWASEWFILWVYYIFILRPSSIGLGEQYKKWKYYLFHWSLLRNYRINRNCRCFIFFFFTRKIYFYRLQIFWLKKLNIFWLHFYLLFPMHSIGFAKFLNFVNNLSEKKFYKF